MISTRHDSHGGSLAVNNFNNYMLVLACCGHLCPLPLLPFVRPFFGEAQEQRPNRQAMKAHQYGTRVMELMDEHDIALVLHRYDPCVLSGKDPAIFESHSFGV